MSKFSTGEVVTINHRGMWDGFEAEVIDFPCPDGEIFTNIAEKMGGMVHLEPLTPRPDGLNGCFYWKETDLS